MMPAARHPDGGARAFLALPGRHGTLLRQLARREVIGRYQGSVLGLAWSFFNPLILLLVYTAFFTHALGMQAVEQGDARVPYSHVLFVGLIIHGFFAECAQRAPKLVLSNPSYVKKVVFPLEILPWVSVVSATFHFAVSLLVLTVFVLATGGTLPATFPLVVLLVPPLVLLCLAVGWLFAALGVYIRDLGQVVGLLVTAMMFTAPVFFPFERFGDTAFARVVALNPLTFLINQARDVTIWGRAPDVLGLGLYMLVAGLAAWAAYWWFQRARRGFADVL
jgi:lipopolysaccharide transport system permease protein